MSPIAVPHKTTSVPEEQPPAFEDIPPFPDSVPTAPLLRISLSKLVAGDSEEEERVWDASCRLGFFYLDLRCSCDFQAQGYGCVNWHGGVDGDAESQFGSAAEGSGDGLLGDAERLFGLGKEIFGLPVEEKEKYDFKDRGSYFGYKGLGAGVVDKEGNRDRNEFYNVGFFFLLSCFLPSILQESGLEVVGD